MPVFQLTMDSGIKVRAIGVYQTETYEGGLAIGRHSKERVERDLVHFRKVAEQIQRAAPIAVILPEDLGLAGKSWCLPFFVNTVWFVSEYVPDDSFHATHLAVIYFQDEPQPYLSPSNERLIRALDWRQLAAGFLY